MNQEFDLDDFEELLKTQTDKHRMYPDDAVWRNINNRLHGKRRWPALTFSAILTVAVLTAGFIFLHPKKDFFNQSDFLVDNINAGKSQIIVADKHISQPRNIIKGLKPADEKAVIYTINGLANQSNENTIVETEVAFEMPSNNTVVVSLNEPVSAQPQYKSSVNLDKSLLPKLANNSSVKIVAAEIADKTMLEAFFPQEHFLIDENPRPETEKTENDSKQIDLTGQKENTTNKNTVSAAAKKDKEIVENPWEMMFYATPSVSYRTLSLDKSYDAHYPYNSALSGNPRNDVNNYVNQRPAVGLEVGASLSYATSNKLKIKAGLQFNYRQYNFNGYISQTQQVTSLLLNQGTYADSIITYTNINTQGVDAVNMSNRYYQLSIPIGFEYSVLQGKKVDIAFGATLQPTYQFNKNTYMVTSDYKAYTIQPDLARRININTGIEIMARFKAAGVQWQMGPQLRYQMLPTQINSYIIHERLVDYGLKIGIVKQLK